MDIHYSIFGFTIISFIDIQCSHLFCAKPNFENTIFKNRLSGVPQAEQCRSKSGAADQGKYFWGWCNSFWEMIIVWSDILYICNGQVLAFIRNEWVDAYQVNTLNNSYNGGLGYGSWLSPDFTHLQLFPSWAEFWWLDVSLLLKFTYIFDYI